MLNFPSNTTPAPVNWAKRNCAARRWLVVLAAAVTVAYVLLFLIQEIRPEFRRADLFLWLTLPDLLLSSVTGGETNSGRLSFADRVIPLVLAAVWLAVANCIGQALTNPIAKLVSRIERFSLSCLIGLSLLSTGILLLGLVGWLTRTAVVALVVAELVAAYLVARRTRAAAQSVVDQNEAVGDVQLTSQIAIWLWRLVPLSVFALALTYILSGLMPAFEFDAVEYHLQGPKEFYQVGQIAFVPHNVYLNMPLGAEMHALAMMVLYGGELGWWFGGMAGKLIIATYSLMAATLAAGWVARHFGRTAGWSAAAMLLSAPGSIHVAGCGLIDFAVGAYALASVIGIEIVRESKLRNTTVLAWSMVMVCLLVGAAAACKYTSVVFLVFPAIVAVATILGRQGVRRISIGSWGLCLLAFAVTIGPWLGKNTLATGNPVYPLASAVFGRGNLSEEQAQRWNRAHRVPASPSGARYGWQAISSSARQATIASEYLPLAVIPLSLLAVIAIPLADRTVAGKGRDWLRHPAFLPMIFAAWMFVAWFAFTHRIDRFWLPAIPLLVIMAASCVHWLTVNGFQSLAGAITLLGTVFGLLISLAGVQADSRWFLSYESLRRDVGSESAPGRLSVTIDWVNNNLSAEARLLLIGQAQAYRFERPIAYATCFNTPPGEDNLRGMSSEQQLNWLAENGFTHVLVQWSEVDRYRSPGNYGFSNWPTHTELQTMVEQGVFKAVEWPIDSRAAELFEVVGLKGSQNVEVAP